MRLRQAVAVLISCVVFTTQTVLSHALESRSYDVIRGRDRSETRTNLWSERRQARELTSAPTQLASALSFPAPRLAPTASFLSRRSHFPENSVPASLNAAVQAIPSRYGSIRAVALPTGEMKGIVLHISDIHKNTEAQANIAATIRYVATRHPLASLALEGSSGRIHLSGFHTFPDPTAVKTVADQLLAENRISGPIHAAIALPGLRVDGIDDANAHSRNVKAVRNALSLRAKAKENLSAAEHSHLRQKQTFNPDLARLDAAVESYRKGEKGFGDHVSDLRARMPDAEVPVIDVFLEALRLERSLHFPTVEREREQLLGRLLPTLTVEETNFLVRNSVQLRTGEMSHADFYAEFSHVLRRKGIDLIRTPALKDYLRYVELSDQINSDTLMAEAAALEEEAYAAVVRTTAESDAVAQGQRLHLTSRLLDFALTPAEWKAYQKTGGNPGYASFEDFYRVAEERDTLMTRHFVSATKNKPGLVVLVTGGFHANGMTPDLVKNGWAVISYTPRLTKISQEDGTVAALSLFQREQTPLERLFSGEQLFLAGESIARAAHNEGMARLAGEGLQRRTVSFSRISTWFIDAVQGLNGWALTGWRSVNREIVLTLARAGTTLELNLLYDENGRYQGMRLLKLAPNSIIYNALLNNEKYNDRPGLQMLLGILGMSAEGAIAVALRLWWPEYSALLYGYLAFLTLFHAVTRRGDAKELHTPFSWALFTHGFVFLLYAFLPLDYLWSAVLAHLIYDLIIMVRPLQTPWGERLITRWIPDLLVHVHPDWRRIQTWAENRKIKIIGRPSFRWMEVVADSLELLSSGEIRHLFDSVSPFTVSFVPTETKNTMFIDLASLEKQSQFDPVLQDIVLREEVIQRGIDQAFSRLALEAIEIEPTPENSELTHLVIFDPMAAREKAVLENRADTLLAIERALFGSQDALEIPYTTDIRTSREPGIIPALLSIQSLIPDPWNRERWEKWTYEEKLKEGSLLVARINKRVVGSLVFTWQEEAEAPADSDSALETSSLTEVLIQHLAVHPAYRNRRVGTDLVSAVKNIVARDPNAVLVVYTEIVIPPGGTAENHAATKFFRDMGFDVQQNIASTESPDGTIYDVYRHVLWPISVGDSDSGGRKKEFHERHKKQDRERGHFFKILEFMNRVHWLDDSQKLLFEFIGNHPNMAAVYGFSNVEFQKALDNAQEILSRRMNEKIKTETGEQRTRWDQLNKQDKWELEELLKRDSTTWEAALSYIDYVHRTGSAPLMLEDTRVVAKERGLDPDHVTTKVLFAPSYEFFLTYRPLQFLFNHKGSFLTTLVRAAGILFIHATTAATATALTYLVPKWLGIGWGWGLLVLLYALIANFGAWVIALSHPKGPVGTSEKIVLAPAFIPNFIAHALYNLGNVMSEKFFKISALLMMGEEAERQKQLRQVRHDIMNVNSQSTEYLWLLLEEKSTPEWEKRVRDSQESWRESQSNLSAWVQNTKDVFDENAIRLLQKAIDEVNKNLAVISDLVNDPNAPESSFVKLIRRNVTKTVEGPNGLSTRLKAVYEETSVESLPTLLGRFASLWHYTGGRNVQVDIDLPESDSSIRVQENTFGWVIQNLISNAARAGARHVRISTTRTDDRVRIRVQDDGPGIDNSLLSDGELFKDGVSRSKSSGMGLAYAQSSAQRWGGTISASNDPAGGALFTLDLPVVKAAPTATVTAHPLGSVLRRSDRPLWSAAESLLTFSAAVLMFIVALPHAWILFRHQPIALYALASLCLMISNFIYIRMHGTRFTFRFTDAAGEDRLADVTMDDGAFFKDIGDILTDMGKEPTETERRILIRQAFDVPTDPEISELDLATQVLNVTRSRLFRASVIYHLLPFHLLVIVTITGAYALMADYPLMAAGHFLWNWAFTWATIVVGSMSFLHIRHNRTARLGNPLGTTAEPEQNPGEYPAPDVQLIQHTNDKASLSVFNAATLMLTAFVAAYLLNAPWYGYIPGIILAARMIIVWIAISRRFAHRNQAYDLISGFRHAAHLKGSFLPRNSTWRIRLAHLMKRTRLAGIQDGQVAVHKENMSRLHPLIQAWMLRHEKHHLLFQSFFRKANAVPVLGLATAALEEILVTFLDFIPIPTIELRRPWQKHLKQALISAKATGGRVVTLVNPFEEPSEKGNRDDYRRYEKSLQSMFEKTSEKDVILLVGESPDALKADVEARGLITRATVLFIPQDDFFGPDQFIRMPHPAVMEILSAVALPEMIIGGVVPELFQRGDVVPVFGGLLGALSTGLLQLEKPLRVLVPRYLTGTIQPNHLMVVPFVMVGTHSFGTMAGYDPQRSMNWISDIRAAIGDLVPMDQQGLDEILDQAFAPGATVISLGTGTEPKWELPLVRSGMRVIGYENDPERIESSEAYLASQDLTAEERARIDIREADFFSFINQAPAARGDVVVLNSPLPENDWIDAMADGRVAASIDSLLKPGGWAFVLTENDSYYTEEELDDRERQRLPFNLKLDDGRALLATRRSLEARFGADNVIMKDRLPDGYGGYPLVSAQAVGKYTFFAVRKPITEAVPPQPSETEPNNRTVVLSESLRENAAIEITGPLLYPGSNADAQFLLTDIATRPGIDTIIYMDPAFHRDYHVQITGSPATADFLKNRLIYSLTARGFQVNNGEPSDNGDSVLTITYPDTGRTVRLVLSSANALDPALHAEAGTIGHVHVQRSGYEGSLSGKQMAPAFYSRMLSLLRDGGTLSIDQLPSQPPFLFLSPQLIGLRVVETGPNGRFLFIKERTVDPTLIERMIRLDRDFYDHVAVHRFVGRTGGIVSAHIGLMKVGWSLFGCFDKDVVDAILGQLTNFALEIRSDFPALASDLLALTPATTPRVSHEDLTETADLLVDAAVALADHPRENAENIVNRLLRGTASSRGLNEGRGDGTPVTWDWWAHVEDPRWESIVTEKLHQRLPSGLSEPQARALMAALREMNVLPSANFSGMGVMVARIENENDLTQAEALARRYPDRRLTLLMDQPTYDRLPIRVHQDRRWSVYIHNRDLFADGALVVAEMQNNLPPHLRDRLHDVVWVFFDQPRLDMRGITPGSRLERLIRLLFITDSGTGTGILSLGRHLLLESVINALTTSRHA